MEQKFLIISEDQLQDTLNKIIKDAFQMQGFNTQRKKWLTTAEVATLFGISRRTVYWWVSKRILTACKVSGTQLFEYDQIELLLKKTKKVEI